MEIHIQQPNYLIVILEILVSLADKYVSWLFERSSSCIQRRKRIKMHTRLIKGDMHLQLVGASLCQFSATFQ